MADGHHQPEEFQAQAEAIHASQAKARSQHRTGVTWGGLAPEAPKVEAVDEIADRLCSEANARAVFLAAPRGRFLTAVQALADDERASFLKLIGYYDRNLSDAREPLDIEAVGKCLRILAPLDCRAAQDAELALADLLVEAAQAEAA